MVSEARKQSMAWMETDYSQDFRWKIKWRLEFWGALRIMGRQLLKGAHELCGKCLTLAFKLLTCQLRHVSIQYHVLLLHCTTTGRQSSTVHMRGIHGISVYKTHRIPRYIPCFTRLFVGLRRAPKPFRNSSERFCRADK